MSAPDRHLDWFPELSPPPGGLAALRARIAHDEQRRARRWFVLGVAPSLAVACALLVLLILPKERALPPPRLDAVVAARLGLVPTPAGVEVTRDEHGSFSGVVLSSSAEVEVVWIGAGSLASESHQ